jgi:hypothetical protein
VRQNDQVTVLDKHFADIGSDFDGDGKNESGDLGIYRVVAGMDDVALPNGTTQHAVRVDMIALARVTLSATGESSPATQVALQSTWYASGIGVVKRRLTTPVSATSDEVAEEVLTYFDGITKGFGAKPASVARMADDATVGAGQALQSAHDVVAFPDHAVIISSFVDAQSTRYTAFSSIDTNGKVTHTSLYAGGASGRYVPVGSQLVAVMPSSDINQRCQVQLLRFDSNGVQPTSSSNSVVTFAPAAGQTLCSDVSQLMFASDGNRLWLAMVRHSLSSSGWVTDLFVQPFDANGTPLAGETTVLSVNTFQSDSVSLSPGIALKSISAAGNKVLIAYITDNSGSVKLASITDAGIVTRASYAPATASSVGPTLLATQSAAALLWQGAQDSSTHLAPALGVMLDSNLTPLLSSGSSSLDAQTLPAALAGCVNCAVFQNLGSDALLIGRTDFPTDKPGTMTFAIYKTNVGALASQTVSPVQLSLAEVSSYGSGINRVQLVPFADRMLVLVTANNQLYTKIVWSP